MSIFNGKHLILSISTLLSFFIFQSCREVEKTGTIPELLSIIKPDTVLFAIDDNTPLELQTLHIAEVNGKPWLCFVNELNHTFYYKNWLENDSFRTVQLSSTGPNALGPLPNASATLVAKGVMVYNPDIYTLFLISKEKGNILNKWRLNADLIEIEKKLAPAMVVDGRQMHNIGDSLLLLSGFVGYRTNDYSRVCSQTVFDLYADSSKVKGVLPFPVKYNQGNWGKFLYYVTDAARVGDKKIVVNFPLIDSLYLIDFSNLNSITSISAKSAHLVSNPIKPLSVDQAERYHDKDKEQWFDFTNQLYLKVLYDERSEKYLRIFRNEPVTEDEIKKQNGKFWLGSKFVIAFFDKSGKYLGSAGLPIDYYYLMGSFIQGGKLFLIPRPEMQQKESYFQMHSFNLSLVYSNFVEE